MEASRKDGFHVLRHTYASVLLEAGQSTVTLARWPGHSSPTITLDHFMPEAGGKGRAAIRALLGTVPEYAPEGLAVLGCQEFPSRNHGRPELGR
ncbi:hypothetical protein ABZ667_21510 [Streptomyces lavendulae]|uniref:hypothetical protein n=1 Tax=Streptomyces lavendulae TaxID=1914 RepID=UPI0033F3E637